MSLLPPKYYLLHFDEETGEILSFHNPMRGKPSESPTITISLEQHAELQPNTNGWRVISNKLTKVDNVLEEPVRTKINVQQAIIGGLVIDGVCYALEPTALSVMTLDLSTGSTKVRAIVHTPEGTLLEALVRDDALKVADIIAEHLIGLHLG